MLKNFYKNKTILVTGHTGFKGAWLSLVLHYFGADVHGISLRPYDRRGNLYKILGLKKIIKSNYLDIRNMKKLDKKLQQIKPEMIFHLAAQPFVIESYRNPIQTIESNINGICNLLESSKKNEKLKAILNITTDKCYENLEKGQPFKEIDKLGGLDIYSASKACSEILTKAYYKSFFEKKINISTARAGNIIGGGDFGDDRIIPDLIDAVINNRYLEVRSPKSIRPWQHILDVINGYLILMKKTYQANNFFESYNFAPQTKRYYNVMSVVEGMSEKLKYNKIKYGKSTKYKESIILRLNSSKATKDLKWKPKFTITQTLNKTADWYKSYINNDNIIEKSYDDIVEYFN